MDHEHTRQLVHSFVWIDLRLEPQQIFISMAWVQLQSVVAESYTFPRVSLRELGFGIGLSHFCHSCTLCRVRLFDRKIRKIRGDHTGSIVPMHSPHRSGFRYSLIYCLSEWTSATIISDLDAAGLRYSAYVVSKSLSIQLRLKVSLEFAQ